MKNQLRKILIGPLLEFLCYIVVCSEVLSHGSRENNTKLHGCLDDFQNTQSIDDLKMQIHIVGDVLRQFSIYKKSIYGH
jgi:hypothetical protein